MGSTAPADCWWVVTGEESSLKVTFVLPELMGLPVLGVILGYIKLFGGLCFGFVSFNRQYDSIAYFMAVLYREIHVHFQRVS